jgi:hypothetical protein
MVLPVLRSVGPMDPQKKNINFVVSLAVYGFNVKFRGKIKVLNNYYYI